MPLKLFSQKSKKSSKLGDKNKDINPHSFLCLVLVGDRVQAAMWQVENKKVELVEQSVIHRYENNEDGLIKIDEALQELGPDSEKLSEVVFGFDPRWIGDSGLKKTHKSFIKNITQSLQLNPMGFVVVTDALIQQLIIDSPLDSSVLVYAQDKHVYIFLIKQGKLVNSLSVGRSENIVNDIVEGLARFKRSSKEKDGYLPAKVILASLVMDSAELIETQQAVLNYDWADNHPFLQTPVIEILDTVKLLQAVVYQGGAAVSKTKGLEINDGGKVVANAIASSNLAIGDDSKSGNDFGFEEVQVKGDNFGSATSFGIPMKEDKLLDADQDQEKPIDKDKDEEPKVIKKPKNQKNKKLSKMLAWFKNHPHKNVITIGAVGGLLALIATFVIVTMSTYQAKLLITPDQETISKDVAIILDSSIKESDPENLILKATIEEKEVNGTDSIETTGIKHVGDKAAGSITIFNKTTSEKTFAEGTSFSDQGRSFTLNEEITVASASVQQQSGGETKEYGQADANVTAVEIGDESNLTKDTELKANSFDTDTYSAKVKDSFTGGASREIRVVAKIDQDTLLKALKQDLIKKGEEEYSNDSGDGRYYVVTGDNKVVLVEFSSELGEEAENLNLDLVMNIGAVAYQSEDIRPLIVVALSEEIPDGYELLDEDPEILSSPSSEATSGARVVLDANVSAKVGPKLDREELIRSVLGLNFSEAIGRLQQKNTIQEVDYQLKPVYAGWFIRKIPNDFERVTIETQ